MWQFLAAAYRRIRRAADGRKVRATAAPAGLGSDTLSELSDPEVRSRAVGWMSVNPIHTYIHTYIHAYIHASISHACFFASVSPVLRRQTVVDHEQVLSELVREVINKYPRL